MFQDTCLFFVPRACWSAVVATVTPAAKPTFPLLLPGSLTVEALVAAFFSTSGAVSPKTRIAEAKGDPDYDGRKNEDEAKNLEACVM